ncbi:hypothetical protein NDU88_005980, partial [Pleurodeles waltl]
PDNESVLQAKCYAGRTAWGIIATYLQLNVCQNENMSLRQRGGKRALLQLHSLAQPPEATCRLSMGSRFLGPVLKRQQFQPWPGHCKGRFYAVPLQTEAPEVCRGLYTDTLSWACQWQLIIPQALFKRFPIPSDAMLTPGPSPVPPAPALTQTLPPCLPPPILEPLLASGKSLRFRRQAHCLLGVKEYREAVMTCMGSSGQILTSLRL